MSNTLDGTVEPPVDVWAEATAREIERGASAVQESSMRRTTPWRHFRTRFGRQRSGVVAVGFLAFATVVAIMGPYVTPTTRTSRTCRRSCSTPAARTGWAPTTSVATCSPG